MTKKPTKYAFPLASDYGDEMGMTLRDYFAGQALAGELAAQNEAAGTYSTNTDDDFLIERSRFFYRFADAMLKAREATQ